MLGSDWGSLLKCLLHPGPCYDNICPLSTSLEKCVFTINRPQTGSQCPQGSSLYAGQRASAQTYITLWWGTDKNVNCFIHVLYFLGGVWETNASWYDVNGNQMSFPVQGTLKWLAFSIFDFPMHLFSSLPFILLSLSSFVYEDRKLQDKSNLNSWVPWENCPNHKGCVLGQGRGGGERDRDLCWYRMSDVCQGLFGTTVHVNLMMQWLIVH